eukprot:CAMPEP_0185570822 /NCGR_PEP_ID=MMETSP0434-20130131/2987_1 /TAXON_ID=626734 ORGANISM="Favella taraikaensis, Strain Fe Narragansett Bay" /NCGR_SAMPLE_ID=MMETSP0434 /ASSEMBLY_ACC=CAM_ASM_000379 /LENGTH=293 /DNA_ID=CAMNT_0028186031 /DNA_START=1813 /DNA_END=2694 /DNA_ORIENTATION=-
MSAGPQTSGQLESYHIGRVIGQGAYAAVRLCLDKRNQKKYAMKIYEKYRLQDPMKRKAAQREITVLKRLQHPGIIKLHDLIDTPKQIYIVTDYVKGISSTKYSKSLTNRIVRETTARRIFKQVAESVAYLHGINTVHRDIKLDNILIEEGTRMVKLIDFGFSVVVASHQRLKIFCGTPSYMSPEIVRKHEYDGKPVDMWALGVLLYVMLTGTFPFRGVSEQDLYQKIQRGQYRTNHDSLSADARKVIGRLLDTDARRRMTADELIESTYVKCEDIRLTVFEQAGSIMRKALHQ